MQAQTSTRYPFIDTITQGNRIEVMRRIPANSVNSILSDPPYLVNYRDRSGRTIQTDANIDCLKPAMREAYRVLKQDRVAIMFSGGMKVDAFFDGSKAAGFRPDGHLVLRKTYSSKSRFLRYQHEQAYLLAKGRPPLPKCAGAGGPRFRPPNGRRVSPSRTTIHFPSSANFWRPTLLMPSFLPSMSTMQLTSFSRVWST
jgi:DNA modification methylase